MQLHTLILTLTILATIVNLVYWCFLFSKFAFYKEEKNDKKEDFRAPPISLIICARNEEANLKKNLPHILNQTYRSLEIIVVNDDSNDNTQNVLLEFQKKYPYLRIINLTNKKKRNSGKKFALSAGIEAAQNEVLLLTDADCQPASSLWAHKMQQLIRGNIEMGLGYGPYRAASGLLNAFIQYETVYTAIQYFSFALAGHTYMGVGRNIIYKKKLYQQAEGFTKHQHIASGDDDLFVRDVAQQHNVKIILDPDTFMYSEPKQTWKTYYRQKLRHLSTANVYKTYHKFLLGSLSASHFLHYFGIFLLILKFSIIFAGVIYMVRIGILLFMYSKILNTLNKPLQIKWIPILDGLYMFFYIIFLPSLFTGKNNQWT